MWCSQVGVIEMIVEFFNVHFPDAQIGTDHFKNCLYEVLTSYESVKSGHFLVKESDSPSRGALEAASEDANSPPTPLIDQARSCYDGCVEKGPEGNIASTSAAADYFPCAFCGEIFPTHAAYEEHAQLSHSGEAGAKASFECDVCGRSFERYLSFKRHRIHHALIKPFVCGLCARAFTRNHDLQRHRANVHRVRGADGGAGKAGGSAHGPSGPFFCERCGLTFERSADLGTHRSTRCRGGPPLPPPNVTFPSESLLSLSFAADCLLARTLKTEETASLPPWKMEAEEAEDEAEMEGTEELSCEHCSARFRLETDLVEHRILEHTPLGEPTSPNGSPTSSSDDPRLPSLPAFPTNPEGPIDLAAKEEPRAASPVDLAQGNASLAEDEETGEPGTGIVVDGPDVWVCMYCSHRFCNKATMDRHMRTHTGEKPFQCPMCVRRFTRKHDLERHRSNIHHGVRPFSCPHCPKTFPLRKNLSKHLLMSHRVGEPS